MAYQIAPIVKASERLLLEIETAVLRWARVHKYSHGAVLRQQAMQVAQLTHQAWRDREHQALRLDDLSVAMDGLKISLQLGNQIKAFASHAQFELIARLASDLGRQLGGWRKSHRKGRNAQASAPGQRASLLSSQIASQGAHP